ncbi:glycoside hydrolase superfamily [Clohesyomyces aquaticus]|uniref:glucan endo-1,3-beta-D-glucosidase n=1 Tax=Clohesyomyces aquaticus TaxID=1231657 RepID=A0A1Y2A7F5_9PLEO|nr:glycoside hydrolase superfamily [Clohesyomyces aquaticus]
MSPPPPPPPPSHRLPPAARQYAAAPPTTSQKYSDYSQPGVTPGVDNLGESAAGGGINGIAIGVANMNERESGLQARNQMGTPSAENGGYGQAMPPRRPVQPQPSYGSSVPLAAGAMTPASVMAASEHSSQRSIRLDPRPSPPQHAIPYQDNPYNRYSSSHLDLAPHALGEINPNDVADDDDWGMATTQQQKRRSFIPFGSGSRGTSREGTPGAIPLAAGGTEAGAYAATRDASGKYNAVPLASDLNGSGSAVNEKALTAGWKERENHSKKRRKWIIIAVIALVVIGAVVGGVLGTMLNKNKGGPAKSKDGNQSPESVANDNKQDLTIKSAEIQKLMNNKNLHKVFPGMDYTPLNAQYPDCIHVKPSQNNITRDIAVLSQLTNAVRLYGTDCNQTEMVLEAISRLELTDMKVWLGVWLGNNATTNDRQVKQMWDILDNNKADKFKGVIIGNEVLFRKDLTSTELFKVIGDVKKNFTSKGIKLPVATSDLGDNWKAEMITGLPADETVDIVMSNVHPFFAGVTVDKAAGWTWDFWNSHDVVLTKGNTAIKQIIAEVGWPSAGGTDCGMALTCTDGSVAGIDQMNQFMNDWVCQSLSNGTEYFWFEAFDEPWKIQFNEKGKEWEDKWGLMDIDRNLKAGVKIPDCGGKTAS